MCHLKKIVDSFFPMLATCSAQLILLDLNKLIILARITLGIVYMSEQIK